MKTKIKISPRDLKNIEKKITKDSKTNKIINLVNKLDLSELGKRLKNVKVGRKAYPVIVAMRVWLMAISEGTQGARDIEEKCGDSDKYKFLSMGLQPSASYFMRWKKPVLELIRGINLNFKKYLIKNELLDIKLLGIDGVKVECWASKRKNKTEEQIKKTLDQIEEELKNSQQIEVRMKKLLNKHIKYKMRLEELLKRKEISKDKTEKELKEMRINITSPITGLMQKRNGQYIQGLNLQGVVSPEQIIVSLLCSSACNDVGMLGKVSDRMEHDLSLDLKGSTILADSGYWNIKDVIRFDPEKGYNVIMPSQKKVSEERKRKVGRKRKAGYGVENGFKYKEKEDVILCPSGKKLLRKNNEKINEYTEKRVYRISSKICSSCAMKESCLGKVKKNYKSFTFTIENDSMKRMTANYSQEKNKELYKKRSIINEPMHAQIFHNNGIYKIQSILDINLIGTVAMLDFLHTLKKVERKYKSYFPVELTSLLTGVLFFVKIKTDKNLAMLRILYIFLHF
jgi:hypothetical protein